MGWATLVSPEYIASCLKDLKLRRTSGEQRWTVGHFPSSTSRLFDLPYRAPEMKQNYLPACMPYKLCLSGLRKTKNTIDIAWIIRSRSRGFERNMPTKEVRIPKNCRKLFYENFFLFRLSSLKIHVFVASYIQIFAVKFVYSRWSSIQKMLLRELVLKIKLVWNCWILMMRMVFKITT